MISFNNNTLEIDVGNVQKIVRITVERNGQREWIWISDQDFWLLAKSNIGTMLEIGWFLEVDGDQACFVIEGRKFKGIQIPHSGGVFISGVVGLMVAVAIRETGIKFLGGDLAPALAFVVGYAGGDFLENIYKIIVKKSSIYEK